jgi:signal transduction histidine kinase
LGPRLQARRDDAAGRALLRLTLSYLGVFGLVILVISFVAYGFVASTYRSIVAPALDTPEGQAGLANALRPALYAIVSVDALLLIAVGTASYALARQALRPLVQAREREARFASDVAHELRTPLGAIASLAETAQADAPDPARSTFASIARRALECGELVGDLLTLARAGGSDSLDREPVDLAIVVRQVLRDRAVADDSIRVDARYESANLLGDERRLRQLARNLIDNACAHARSRITIVVGVERGMAKLSVDDDGPGVPAELAPRLFERFVKGPHSKGSGLGLAISRWIAGAHGGEIAFTGGSHFEVRLPITLRQARAALDS